MGFILSIKLLIILGKTIDFCQENIENRCFDFDQKKGLKAALHQQMKNNFRW